MNEPERAPDEVIAKALYAHQWEGSGAPTDESECCARVVLEALEAEGFVVVPKSLVELLRSMTIFRDEEVE